MRRLLQGSLVLVLLAGPAAAQSLSVDLGADGSLAMRSMQLLVLVTVLSLVPGILMMLTCFPFMVTVLSVLRQAIGLQQAPPNMLIISLALFLTYFVMEPVFLASWHAGIEPWANGNLAVEDAFRLALEPFDKFMLLRVDPGTLMRLSDMRSGSGQVVDLAHPAPSVLIPAFMLSEIARAFQVGFLIYLPFLIIDLIVSAVLMSMGMMMVPPAVVSLPFKLAFFVVADGWVLLSEGLLRSYL